MIFQKLFVSSVSLIIIDSIYLQLIKQHFQTQIYIIQHSPLKINFLATILCYLLLIASINYFILFSRNNLLDAFLLGFFIYGVFETTNKALFTRWKISTVLIDTIWGGILFTLTTYITNSFIHNL